MSVSQPILNPSVLDTISQTLVQSTTILGGVYGVDTFFFLSGLVAMRGIVKRLDSSNTSGFLNTYIKLVLGRYIRLTPVYLVTMWFYIKAMPWSGSGPYWPMTMNATLVEEECEYWWANLLYINNIYPWEDRQHTGTVSCMGWTWYLATEMQIFLLCPILAGVFVYFHQRRPQAWYRLYGPALLLVLGQIIVTFVISMTIVEQSSIFTPEEIYSSPYCRLSPYIMGCMVAMRQYQTEKQWERDQPPPLDSPTPPPHSPTSLRVHLTSALSLGLMSGVILIVYLNYSCQDGEQCFQYFAVVNYLFTSTNWPRWGNALYLALSYPTWGMCLAWLTQYAVNGHGGTVTWILSRPIWAPLSRLTYGAYMTHVIVIKMVIASTPGPLVISSVRFYVDSVSYVVMAYALALFVFMFVEHPISNWLNHTLRLRARERHEQVDPQTQALLHE